MEKITTTVEVFPFDELDAKAKEVAMENHRDIHTGDYYWDEVTKWNIDDELKEFGFENITILYSGFGSQGDGACFEATLDGDGLLKLLKAEKLLTQYRNIVRAIRNGTIYVNIKIEHSGRYYHEYMTDTNDYTEMQDNAELTGVLADEWEALMTWFDDRVTGKTDKTKNCGDGWLIRMNKKIYKTFEDEYWYQSSDEAVEEALTEGDYKFFADGTDYNA